MQVPTHPLLALVDEHATGLKSMLTLYIDATVDSQFASLRNSIETMIQSGVIGPNCDGTHFGMTLPPQTHTNTHQSSDECSHEYSNDELTRTQEHRNTMKNEVSLSNTINTNVQMIKQEFDVDDSVEKCEKCKKGICTSGDDAEIEENGNESYDTIQQNIHALENNQTNQLIISNDISPSPTNPTNTEPLIKQEFLNDSSITSIPLDFPNNAAPNDIFTDKQTEGQNTQIQTDEFGDNENDDDYYEDDVSAEDEDEENLDETQFQIDVSPTNTQGDNMLKNVVPLANTINSNDPMIKQEFDVDEDEEEIDDDNVSICEKSDKRICISVLENYDNTFGNHSDNEDEPQLDNYASLENNKTNQWIVSSDQEVINAIDDTTENIELHLNDQSDQLQNVHTEKSSGKRKSVQLNKRVKKAKHQNVEDDIEDNDDDNDDQKEDKMTIEHYDHAQYNSDDDMVIQEEKDANNAIGEEMVTQCTTNPIQPNLAQPNCHFQCSHCHKSFAFTSKLQQHLRVHTGERPFPCDQCDKRFKDRGNLTKHQLIHQNIKPFQCTECDKKFTRKDHLDSHLRIHSGDRPFACSHCEMLFTDLCSKNRHEQAIHLHVKPHRCKQCGHSATQRADVIRHIREVHFGLPRTIKEQRALNIFDEREPRELVEKVTT